MKTVDFNKHFKNVKGEDVEGNMSDSLAETLFNAGAAGFPIDDKDKFRAYKISTKLIANNGVIEPDNSDIELLKTFCAVAFTAGAYGQIVELLEN